SQKRGALARAPFLRWVADVRVGVRFADARAHECREQTNQGMKIGCSEARCYGGNGMHGMNGMNGMLCDEARKTAAILFACSSTSLRFATLELTQECRALLVSHSLS